MGTKIMKATGKINKRTTTIRAPNPVIPDGTYPGVWSGYQVEFTVFCTTYIVGDLSNGVRSFGAECTVTVKDGEIEVSA